MANDSLEIRKDEVPFHPCLTPRGTTWYDLDVLTAVQQKLLNELKSRTIREDKIYLAKHPEVRALVVLFLRAILRDKPKLKSVSDFAKDFFCSRPLTDLQLEVDEYLTAKGEQFKKEGDSALEIAKLFRSPRSRSSMQDMADVYHKDYYSWTTFTDEPDLSGLTEPAPEWGSYSDMDQLRYTDFPDSTITASAMSGSDTTERRDFELLFASRATLYSGERYTISFQKNPLKTLTTYCAY